VVTRIKAEFKERVEREFRQELVKLGTQPVKKEEEGNTAQGRAN